MTSGPKRSRSSAKSSSPSSSFRTQRESSTSAGAGEDKLVNGNEGGSPSPEGGYPLIQQRGQRRYGPPSDWTKEPPRGTEVHVSKLPRDMLEDELIPVFESVGKIYEIRLMMETSEINKGFAFIKFCSKEDSDLAIADLNDSEIRPNVKISVRRSIDNNRLFIGNIPKNYLAEDVLQCMKEVSAGVVKVILYASVNDRSKNRGYGFVEFESHQHAKSTRSKLKLSPIVWSGQEVKVDWAEPEPEVNEETMKKVRILYVRNLALITTDHQLRELFSSFGGTIERVKKIKDYAFVHFATRDQAEETMNKLQGYVLDKCEIDISWSKPVTNREEYQQRKAASKALSSATNSGTPINPATLGVSGESLMLSHKVRTAAGAQGYIASRSYSLRPRQNEETFPALQFPFIYPSVSYVQEVAARNLIDQPIAIPTTTLSQTVYTPEKLNHIDDFLASAQDVYQLAQPQLIQRIQPLIAPSAPSPYNVVSAPMVSNTWNGQSFIQPGNTTPTFLHASPYVVPTPTYAPVPGEDYIWAYSPQAFYGGQLMTQIPNISGSNMSIDRA